VVGRIFYADLAVTVGLIIVGFAVLTVGYAIVYKVLGISRYGPLDSPPG
jgi:ABC-type uncharacterized transport system permease subunit